MPTLPPGLGLNCMYITGETGIVGYLSNVSQWQDQSGYIGSGPGWNDAPWRFQNVTIAQKPWHRTSTRVKLADQTWAHYVQFDGIERLRSRNFGGWTDILPFDGGPIAQGDPFYDIYGVVSVKGLTFSGDDLTQGAHWLCLDSYPLNPYNNTIRFFPLDQNQGSSVDAVVGGGAPGGQFGFHQHVYDVNFPAPLLDDNDQYWKILHGHWGYDRDEIFEGYTSTYQQGTSTYTAQNPMPASRRAWLGGSDLYQAQAGDSARRIMFMAAFVNYDTGNHTQTQRDSMVNHILALYPGGAGGGNAML